MIKLPSYEWFMGQIAFRGKGNLYSGSVGCDPYYGDNNEKIFRYRVWIITDENGDRVLKAGYYFGNKSYDETDRDIITENDFESSSDGIIKAQKWLFEACEKSKGESYNVNQR